MQPIVSRTAQLTGRPQFRFTPAQHWLNDPNGLVHHDGEYHLFFQYNPEGDDWRNMSWGHAVSTDLTSWVELPVAIGHTDAEAVFSGSAVIDRANTSGLGTPGQPAMIAIYTGADVATGRQAQALAYSLDRGRTFSRYPGNPVIDIGSTDFRDPKVFWHSASNSWVMVVALSREHVVRIYASPDLLTWRHLSDFGPAGATGGTWECPDLFELPIDGEPGRTAWVLLVSLHPGGIAGGSGTQYFVGDFDGTRFEAFGHGWLDRGRDNYAAVTFNDAPGGQRVLIGWMNNWDYATLAPTTPWRGAMTLPRKLRLRRSGALQLAQRPVLPDLELAPVAMHHHDLKVEDGAAPLPFTGSAYHVAATFAAGTAHEFGLATRLGPPGSGQQTLIGYDRVNGELFVDRTRCGTTDFHETFAGVQRAPLAPGPGGEVSFEVVVDTCSVEVFAADGSVVITDLVFPDPASQGLAVFATGGTATCSTLTVRTQAPPSSKSQVATT